MTLEQAIVENTTALRDLAELLRATGGLPQTKTPPKTFTEAVEQATEIAVAKKIEEKAEKIADIKTSQTAATRPVVPYIEVQEKVQELVRLKQRDAVVNILARFGATNARQLHEKEYHDVVLLCEEVIAEAKRSGA